MKKILFAFILGSLFFTSCKTEEPDPCDNVTCENGQECNEGTCITTTSTFFTVSDQSSFTSSVRVGSGPTDYKLKVHNPNDFDVTVSWDLEKSTDNPSAWSVYVCDATGCLPPNILTGYFNVPAMDSVDYKVTVEDGGDLGLGGAITNLYVSYDSLNSLLSRTISHEVTP